MKSLIFPLMICLVFCSCTESIDIEQLNGYWEIQEVEMENGFKKTYKINTTIEYIEVASDSIGFRTKLYPLADGSFRTTTDKEQLKIKSIHNRVILHYNTDMANWTEEIEALDENRLVTKNDSSIRYIYKRFEKFEIQ